MATLTSQLILSLIDKVTAPARGVAGAVANMSSKLEANNRRLDAMRGRMVEAAAVGYVLAKAIKAPIMAAVEFESSMADVRKVVNFETPQAFKQMSADIVEMSTRIPIAATGIADIVAAAGQAGMAGDELLGFAEMAAKVGVAFDMSAGATGTALAKIKTALQFTVAQTGALADAINYLSNTSAASAPDILDFMSRVGSVGKQYGFTAQQTAAIGSAMIATGAEAEVAATSFRSVGRALTRGASATKSQRRAFKQLGLSATEVAQRMQKDAVGTLRDVIMHIQKLPKALQAAAISDLFGDEARAIAPLIDQIAIYDKAVKSVAQSANYLGSSQKEFETRSETTANNMQLFSNKVTAAGIAIGSALLPALNGVMDALGPVVLAIARFAENNPRLTSTIVALTAGLVGLRIAAIAAQWGFFWMRGAYLQAAIAGLKGVGGAVTAATNALSMFGTRTKAAGQAAFTGFSMAGQAAQSAKASADASKTMIAGMSATALANVNASRQMTAGMTSASGAINVAKGSFRSYGTALIGLLNPMRMVTAAVRVMKFALISTGIGAIVVGLATAGAWIYQNWSGVKAMFVGIGEGIKTAFPGAGAIIDTVSTAISTLVGWFGKITGPITASEQAWRSFGQSIGQAIGGALQTVGEVVSGIMSKLQELASFFGSLTIPAPDFGPVIAAIRSVIDLVAQARAAIVGVSAAGAGSANSNPLKAVMPGDANAKGLNSAVAGARAMGGPVNAGSLYQVGERGRELFVPPVNGHIVNARDTAAMIAGMARPAPVPPPRSLGSISSARGRSSGPSNVSMPITVNVAETNARPDQIARAVGREASAAMRNHFSDGGT